MKSNIRKIKKIIFNVFIKGFFIAYMFSSVNDSIAYETHIMSIHQVDS